MDYLPPEMINKKEYGKEIDIWSIGVLAYEFLNGCPPFDANDQHTTLEKIKNVEENLNFPDHFSPAAIDFIKLILRIF